MSLETSESAIRKVLRRVVPFAMLLFFFNLIDRANISYAALQMNADLGLSPSVYGFAAGIFFIGYFAFEVPSNLILVRVGARIWLARIMVTWGLVVLGMAWVNSETSLYVMRFLLGVAEAGLLPGVIYYLGLWVPAQWRALALSMLMSTNALSNIFGGPIATGLMQLDGLLGFKGWQLVFIGEAIPTVLIGLSILKYLPETPRDARWLTATEKQWLLKTLAEEQSAKSASRGTTLWNTIADRRVILTTVFSFLLICCNFGTVFWLPQIIRALGDLSTLEVGFLASVPYLIGGVGMILWGRHSDRNGDRKWHLVASSATAAVGYAWAGIAPSPTLSFVGLCVATLGVWSMLGVIWALASDLLHGSAPNAAAGGLAFINSFAALGGFVGPFLMGYVRENTDSFSGSLLTLAGFATLMTAAALLLQNYGRVPRQAVT